MNINILSQEYYSDVPSIKLIEYLSDFLQDKDGTILYRFPLIKEIDQEIKFPSVLIVSKHYGVIAFKTTELSIDRNNELDSLEDEVLWIEDYIFSKLIKSQNKKMKKGRRELSFALNSILFAPNLQDTTETECQLITNKTKLEEYFENLEDNQIPDDIIHEIYSIIEGSTGVAKPKERVIATGDKTSKAYILKKLEQEIAVFDEKQKYAALSQLKGPQRIRGLAGTGKTIILAMKAAIIHLNDPSAKILYTFMTKSLYDYIELLITRFYKILGDGNLPDFEDAIHIRHAWGGTNVKGVYYETCVREGVIPVDFMEAKKSTKDPFDYVCDELLAEKSGKLINYYDYILIDEAQDFNPSFYQLCRSIVKDDSIVWGYDDLQNIFDISIQDTIKTFENQYGYDGIDLEELQKAHPEMENDIVLPKSYRNPKEILVLAHAIGFGVYNDHLIQSLENNEHWSDLGYTVKEGNCINGERMIIERKPENSPLSIALHQSSDDIIKVHSAIDFKGEIEYVVNEIIKAITIDKLRADDIMVICLDDRNAKTYFQLISSELHKNDIKSFNLSMSFYQKGFHEDDCVTLTTVYKAKGNESPMVFVIGVDIFEYLKDDTSMRNKIFTSFTRAKAWLYIVGRDMEDSALFQEIEKVKKNNFLMDFIYKESKIIKRDLANVNIEKTKKREVAQRALQDLKKSGMSVKEIKSLLDSENGEI